MIGFFVPGDSLMHRCPAGYKLLALTLALIGLSWVPTTLGLAGALAGATALVLILGTPLRPLVRQLRAVLWWAIGLGVLQSLGESWTAGARVALIFLLSVELASAVTMTTRTEAMMAVLVRLLGPLRALGVDPERPALMVTLMIRAIPVVLGFSEDIRQALYARNARHTPTTLAVPLMIRSLRYADAMAEALDARGFADGAR